ncbi:F-box/kelch-repeat protein At3g23880-like isoform X1 [Lolium rigidum]|uniref:F-box/kelch-repeat protein At3g23880-like isoform X1 n=1 Tax=Lolium rigidum TaxID=89674 RepID=UPI001F5D4F9D|nr:F-box/kelch-repeat protein At3g23880-like isoform X1 [Lolium rigidum]XP_047090699.1 F-box/kelch-repeat protein At3g23880-like isoform X1 [Lolium rigidum]
MSANVSESSGTGDASSSSTTLDPLSSSSPVRLPAVRLACCLPTVAMASSQLLPAASSLGDLPRDALVEILLRIPAKDLCRLRAVCPSWRALTSSPLFVAEHKSRHTAPLLVVAYRDQDIANGVDVVDLSGNIVKRIPSIESDIVVEDESGHVFAVFPVSHDSISVLRTRLDRICFTRKLYPLGLWVLNPATGVTLVLPQCHSEELAHDDEIRANYGRGQVESCALGQVSSTGEYKVIRIATIGDRQLCEVITLDGAYCGKWRGKQSPPALVFASRGEHMRCAVVDGVVYFLMDFYTNYFSTGVLTIEPGSIASFNLETEEWMGTLQGPGPVRTFVEDHENFCYAHLNLQLSLAELDFSLVTVHNNHNISMDLWFLTDFENAIWEKKYYFLPPIAHLGVHPFLVLHDGRILFSHAGGLLKSYDPKTGTYADALEVRDSRSIGIYTGSLLSL